MKEYVVTKSELTELGGLGAFATLFLSAATYLLGLAVDLSKDMAFTAELTADAEGFWSALRLVAGIGSAVCFVLSGLFLAYGGIRLRAILNDTDHGT